MDLFQGYPPYRKVEDEDIDCYWQFQDIGLKGVSSWPLNGSGEHGAYLCLGNEICYLSSGSRLFVIAGE